MTATEDGRVVGADVALVMKDESVESKTSGKSFHELYDLDQELGKGVFSTVKLGHHKETNEEYAIKIISKPEMEEFDKMCLLQEIDVLSELKHPNIIKLHDVFDDKDTVYMILEMVQGGELLQRLIQKKSYTEREARDVCKSVMEAMNHCHQHQIAHRDLKAENLLLASPDDDTTVKIADFGFAKHCPHDEALKTQCGSAQHVAPEILRNEPYGTKVDMWALGVIHYTLIGGRPPFWAPDNQTTFRNILLRDFTFSDDLWGHVSQDCKDMINGLITIDPQQRWSAQDVLNCKWICECDAHELDQHSLTLNQEQLRDFTLAKGKLKAAVYALIGLNRLQFDGEIPEEIIVEEEDGEEAEYETVADDESVVGEEEEPVPLPVEEETTVVEEEETVVQEEETVAEEETVVEEVVEEEEEVVESAVEEEVVAEEEEEEEKEEEFCGIVTRDLYTAFKIQDCTEEPKRKDYFALAQTTGDFIAKMLKDKYGDDFDVVEMTLRKSLYNAGKPTDEYHVYVEWDITAHFACGHDKLPSRREVCTSMVMSNLEGYITDYIRPMEETAFHKTTDVFFGHFAC